MQPSTIRSVLDDYVAHRFIRASSADQLRYSINSIVKFAGGDFEPRKIEASQIIAWLKSRRSVATAQRDRRNLLTVMKHAKKLGHLQFVPEIETIRSERKAPQAWTLDQLGRIIATARKIPGEMRHLPIRRAWWYTTLLLYLYDSSLRVSSALSTKSSNIWIDRGTAMVESSTDKTHTAQVVRLSHELCSYLKLDRFQDRELVWPYPWAKRKLWRDIDGILAAAGLPHGRWHKFHCIRRTHATQAVIVDGWERARADLGHSSIDMTRRYVDVSQVMAAKSAVPLPSPRVV